MRRRQFITLLGGAGTFPFIAHAQQADRMRRIGALMGIAENDVDAKVRAVALRQGLHELGWIEGRNVSIEYRWAALIRSAWPPTWRNSPRSRQT